MSLPVRTVSRLLTPLILVYASYLIIMESSSPGGAFGGGVVFSVAACLVVVAEETGERFASNLKWVNKGRSLGLGIIIIVASLSLLLMGRFLDTRIIIWKGTILVSPLFVTLGFGVGIVVGIQIVIALGEMLDMEEGA